MARRPHPKPTRTYNTHANTKKEMDTIEQEIHELREEVTTLRGELEKLSTLVALLEVAQNPPQFQKGANNKLLYRISFYLFFFGGCEDNRKISWIHWNTICLDNEVGGLRVRRISEFNLELLGKWCWRLVTERHGL